MARKKNKNSQTARHRSKNSPRAGAKELNRLTALVKKQPDNIEARLKLATSYYEQAQYEELIELLEKIAPQYPLSDKQLTSQYDALLSLGYAHLKRFDSAETILKRAMAEEPKALDLWYAKTLLAASLSETEQTIRSGESYLKLHEKLVQAKDETGSYCSNKSHLARVYNLLGSAERDRLKPEKALALYQEGLQVEPDNHLVYANLIALHISLKDYDSAREQVAIGLKNCSQVQELKLLDQSLQRDFTISACLMVKDEEELLPQCLESVRNWVDEIIVVDTGSTDRTIEIAQSYGAKIFHQPWAGSFSKHRNYTLEKATSDWVLIIDADEMMVTEDIPRLLDLMSQSIAPVISINVINVYGENRRRTVFLPSVRLFKRELGIHYDGIVHNQIQIPDEVPTLRADVRLKHFGYDLSKEKMKKKAERSRALLERQLAENEDNAMALFNLAQLIRTGPDETQVERSKEVIEYAARAVELTDPNNLKERHLHLMSLDQLAWSYFYLKDHKSALKFCHEALRQKPDYLDPLILLGHISMDLNRLDEAEGHFNYYLKTVASYDMTHENDNLIINHVDSKIVACYALACAAILKGESETAKARFIEVLAIDANYLEANGLLGQLYLQSNQLDLARKHLACQIDLGPPSSDAHLWMGDLLARSGDAMKAEESYLKALAETDRVKSPLSRLIGLYLNIHQDEKLIKLISNNLGCFAADFSFGRQTATRVAGAGFSSAAIDIYNKMIDGGGGESDLHNDLANCYYRLKNFSEAEKYYKLAVDSSSPPAVAYRNLGLTLFALKRPKEALAALEQYLKCSSEDIALLQVAGDIAASDRDYPVAAGYYERYLAQLAQSGTDLSEPVSKSIVKALCNLSDCYLFMGHRDSAAMGYQRVLAIQPQFEPALAGLAELERATSEA